MFGKSRRSEADWQLNDFFTCYDNAERAKFEKALCQSAYFNGKRLEISEDGDYVNLIVQAAWLGWVFRSKLD